jgi:hypothetical protein
MNGTNVRHQQEGSNMKKTLLPVLGVLTLLCSAPALADGPGELHVDDRRIEVLEESGSVVVFVERSKGEDGAVSVDYTTQDGSATAGADYVATSGTLSWADDDESRKSFTVDLLDDADAEGKETFLVSLSNPTGGATLRPGRAAGTVEIQASDGGSGGNGGGNGGGGGNPNDNDAGIFKFDQRNFRTTEGAGVAVISVERSKGEDGAVSVEYSTADDTAIAGVDYEATSGVLTWEAGDGRRKTFLVSILNDSTRERAEHFDLVLSNPTGGAGLDRARATGKVTIVDNDQGDAPPPGNPDRPGTFQFDERGYVVIEGEQTMAVIAVERSRGQGGAVSVDYSTADATAVDGEDYTGVAGTLDWADGDSTIKTFEVPIADDDLTEGNETVELTLSNPTGGADIRPSRGDSVLTLLDNDGDTAACIDDADTVCLEGGRFQVEAVWRTSDGNTGTGQVIPSTGNSALLWFFSPDNAEVLVKVLDACVEPFNRYWVFFAATTNVDFTVTVTDTQTGVVREYTNPLGQAAESVQDTVSFDTCP